MATKKSTRVQNPAQKASKTTLRSLDPDTRDELHGRLVRANSALITAILALENKGVDGEIASSLRAHVYFPLLDLTEALS